MLNRDDILKAVDLPSEVVRVPEWGGEVLVRGMTGTERDEYEQEIVSMKGENVQMNLRNARAKLVVRCVVDESGGRVFSDEDVRALGKKSAAALDRIFERARRLSGMTKKDVEELSAALKNAQPGDSLTD